MEAALNAYYGQQYIATINALHRSQEVVTRSKEWLSSYEEQVQGRDAIEFCERYKVKAAF